MLSNTNASNPIEVGFTDAERDGGLHFKINECSNQSKEVPIVVFFGSIGEMDIQCTCMNNILNSDITGEPSVSSS